MALRTLPIVVALPLYLIAAQAMAEPKTINDCEAIQAADAYNQCLALFGPVAHEHALSPEPIAAQTATASQGRSAHVRIAHGRSGMSGKGAGRLAARHGRAAAIHVATGRKRMQFSVVPSRSRIQ